MILWIMKMLTIAFLPMARRAEAQLMKLSLKYVAAHSFYDDQLEMQQTVSFHRKCLADELWQRINLCVNRNPTLLEA